MRASGAALHRHRHLPLHRRGGIDEAPARARRGGVRGRARRAPARRPRGCAPQGGVEVDTQGDAFFFAFPTAPGALAAARFFYGGLERRADPGTGRHAHRHAAGRPKRATSATTSTAPPASPRAVTAARCSYRRRRRSLVETELTDLGEHRFKDLSARERVYQLGDLEFPKLKSLYQTNLPSPQRRSSGANASSEVSIAPRAG